MSLNRLLVGFSKNLNNGLYLKRYITTTQCIRFKLNQSILGGHKSDHQPTKSNIDEKLIAKLTAEDPYTDKSELDKPEWERKTRNVSA